MKPPIFPWHSLKMRITLLTLVIFVLGMVTVSLWTAHLLRQDMQALLVQQPGSNAIHLPTAQAVALINAWEQRMWSAIALLALLITACTWWMLQRQLAPLVHTAATLSDWPLHSQLPAALPVTSNDEIGQLMAGFNQVLKTLQQRKQTLRESEERYRTLTEWTPEALAVHRNDTLLYANPAAIRLFGAASAQELLGQSVLRLIHPDDRQMAIEHDRYCTEHGVTSIHQQRFLRLDGSVFDAEFSAILIQYDGQPAVQTAVHDITERKRAEQALQASLRDKEALLNEVHHRVKNNLQVISSLLRLEAGRSRQPDTPSVLQEMQGRIRSMALLHETLYRSGSFASVNLAHYLKQLATQAFRAQTHGSVQLQLALDAVQVSMDMATPCGLLVNELISNALKHAFPDARQGIVRISLMPQVPTPAGKPSWRVEVSDNGVGLPTDFEQRRGQTLGLQLASDLARQLGSMLDIEPNPDAATGARFSVQFIPDSSTGQTSVRHPNADLILHQQDSGR